MVASGLPTVSDDNHADIVAKIALKLLDCIRCFKMNHVPEKAIQLRLGIHSGTVRFKCYKFKYYEFKNHKSKCCRVHLQAIHKTLIIDNFVGVFRILVPHGPLFQSVHFDGPLSYLTKYRYIILTEKM